MRYRLAVLVMRMPWALIDASPAPLFAHGARTGHTVTDADLFGITAEPAGVRVSNAGRPRLPIRLMVALLYLKHASNGSEESVVQRWAQDLYLRFFSGQVHFKPRVPRRSAGRGWCGAVGQDRHRGRRRCGSYQALGVRARDGRRHRAGEDRRPAQHQSATGGGPPPIAQLTTLAGIKLEQRSYAADGPQLHRSAGGHAHARLVKRLRRVRRCQRIILGRQLRNLERKVTGRAARWLQTLMERAWRMRRQRPDGSNKLCALHNNQGRGGLGLPRPRSPSAYQLPQPRPAPDHDRSAAALTGAETSHQADDRAYLEGSWDAAMLAKG